MLSGHTSSGTGAINVVTSDIIQALSTLKQTAFPKIPTITFSRYKIKKKIKKNKVTDKQKDAPRHMYCFFIC